MITDKEIKGNTFIFFLFQICNIALAVLGLFTTALAIYLMTLTKSLNAFNGLFLCFGIILIVLSYFGCKLRNSPLGNYIYSIILTFIFICDMIVTFVLFAYRDEVINWILATYELADNNITQVVVRNVKTVNDLLLLILLLFVKNYLILVSCCCVFVDV
jgi:hypothetical protein